MSTENSTTTEVPASAPAFRFAAVTFDCPDPAELARFYGEALDLPVAFAGDDFVFLAKDGAPGLGFNRLTDYRRPTWPDPAQEKQAHIEIGVDALDPAEARLLSLGATKPAHQPAPDDRWRVLLDPAGHPFCITTLV
ncbi:VOC family protein [Streptomyces sp. NPDC018610]|uniref:VOC family protein n=1 Tax=Streptomyces sp. NPDC018610 TaxID=3365049 RepID=UPI00378D8C77